MGGRWAVPRRLRSALLSARYFARGLSRIDAGVRHPNAIPIRSQRSCAGGALFVRARRSRRPHVTLENVMHYRFNPLELAPEIVQQAQRVQQAVDGAGLDPKLGELIKIRASQINGCAHCINMHTRDARKLGESEARIYLLSAWRESTVFDARERAVLAWTEALTHVAERGAPQDLVATLKEHFNDKEIVAITAAIGVINFWNRFAIGLGAVHPSEREVA
jgi:AhpD family alkylhydroperoxidase